MKKILDERLIYEILSVVEEIPRGKVATYGQIARLIGKEKMQDLWAGSSVWQNTTAVIPATAWSITPEDWFRAGMIRDCFY